MKKYYLILATILFVSSVFSQISSPSGLTIKHKNNPDNRAVNGTISDLFPASSSSVSRTTVISERLSPINMISSYFASVPYLGYSNPIFPDSNAIINWTSGAAPPWLHTVNQIIHIDGEYNTYPGGVFDPTIQPFDPSDTVTIDSVFIQGYYDRVNTSVVDTAIISITAQLNGQYKRGFYFSNPDSTKLVVDYFFKAGNKNAPDSVVATYKVVLDSAFKADSLSNGGHIFAIAPYLSIPNSDGVIGVSLEFKPGKVYSQATDTIFENTNWINVVYSTPMGSGMLFPLGSVEDYTIGSMNDDNSKYGGWSYFLPPFVFTGHHPYQLFDVEIKISQNNSFTTCSTTFGSHSVTACDSYTWTNGIVYSASNSTAKDTFVNALGCDSVVTLNLTITNSPTIVAQPSNRTAVVGNSVIFSASATGASPTKQWQINTGTGFVNVTNGGQYSGATTDALTVANLTLANSTHLFRCIYTIGACSDTTSSATLTVNSPTGLNENDDEEIFTLFPNPTSEKISVNTDTKLLGKRFVVYNEIGKIVREGMINSEKLEIDLKELPSGLYMFVAGSSSKKFIKE